jgi:hypothetical protein
VLLALRCALARDGEGVPVHGDVHGFRVDTGQIRLHHDGRILDDDVDGWDDDVDGWSEAAVEALPEPALLVAEDVGKRSSILARSIDTARVGRHGVSALMNLTSFP